MCRIPPRTHDSTENHGVLIRAKSPEHLLTDLLRVARATPGLSQIWISTSAMLNHFTGDLNPESDDTILASAVVVAALEYFRAQPHAEIETIQIQFTRNSPEWSLLIRRSGAFMEVYAKCGQGISSVSDKVVAITDRIASTFSTVTRAEVAAVEAGDIDARHLKHVDVLTANLAASSDRLNGHIEKAIDEVLKASTTSLQESKDFVLRETERLAAQFKEKEEALAQRVSEFEGIKKQFDDQNNTLVRRRIAEEIKAELKQYRSVKLSNDTNDKHASVGLRCGIMIIVMGILSIGLIGYGLHTDKQIALIPASGAMLVAISTFVYWVRHASAWAKLHADLETENLRYSYDMLRAAWFAEMLFEYKKTKEADIPEAIASVMTKGLFEFRGGSGEAKHPLDDLVDLVHKLKLVTVNKDGVTVERK